MSSVMRFDEWQDSNGVARNAIIAVKDVSKADTFSASVAGGGNVAVTDLSITHTLENSSNKLIISAYFGASGSSGSHGLIGIAIADDGTLINVGSSPGSRTAVTAGGRIDADVGNYLVSMPSVSFVYEPGDTSSHTFTVRAINIGGSTNTLYVNRSEGDTDNAGYSRATSALIIQEVTA